MAAEAFHYLAGLVAAERRKVEWLWKAKWEIFWHSGYMVV